MFNRRTSSLISILPLSVLAADADVYDYVVVGAGSGGCPLASKLAQAGHSVLLLEGGPDSDYKAKDTNGITVDPLEPGSEFGFQFSPDIDDAVLSEPVWQVARNTWVGRDQRFCAQPGVDCVNDKMMPYREFMPRAKIVGGCSMHNYLTYIRPSPDFMEKWGPGWEWNTVLPKLISMENSEEKDVDPRFHGYTGPAYVSNLDLRETDNIVIEMVKKAGIPTNTDINGETRYGFGPLPKHIHNKKRWSAAQAWITPEVRALPNFHLKVMSFATRIEFEGKRATGVTYTQDGVTKLANATKEVILAAGAFRSPQMLMLSGIGPKQLFETWPTLKKVHESEGVGRNLQDHLQARMTVDIKDPALGLGNGLYQNSLGNKGILWPNVSGMKDHLPAGYDGVSMGGFYYSKWCKEKGCTSPDMQYMCGSFPNFLYSAANGLLACSIIINGDIQSTPGWLTLKSLNASEYPAIFPHYLGSDIDIERMAEGAKQYIEDIIGQRPDLLDASAFPPGAPHGTERPIPMDKYREFVRTTATTIYHPVGTAKMGPASDPLAVTDQQGRVHGVEALRVVDASIMPVIANVNTDVPTRLIGYHIADLIIGETSLLQ